MRKISRLILIIITLALLAVALFHYNTRDNYLIKYRELINKYSAIYDLDIYLVVSIIKVESDFDPSALSSAGAVGLMQVMPKTAEWVCSMIGERYEYSRLTDPEYNIMIGVAYISYLMRRFDSDYLLMAYNAGESVVDRWLKDGLETSDIPYPETKKYVLQVRETISQYKKRYYLY